MKIKLTKWDRQRLHELLSNQGIGRAPLGQVQDMLDARAKLDPSDLNGELDKKYELNFSQSQIDHIHRLATNPQITWPINDHSSRLFTVLEEAASDKKDTDG